MTYKRKYKPLAIIRRSVLTGKAVWVSHKRTYKAEWRAYKQACTREVNRMRQWGNMCNRRRRNILNFINELTANLPILGDLPPEKRAALKFLRQMAETDPDKHSDFYDHICEEKRLKRNAKRREKRWQEKYGNKN